MYKIIIAVSVVLFSSGCSRTIEYYEYSSEQISIGDWGVVKVGLSGEFEKGDSSLEKKTTRGNPYSVIISFVPYSDVKFCINKLLLSQGRSEKEINHAGSECGKKANFKDFEPGTKLYLFEKINIELGKPVTLTIKSVIGSSDKKEIVVNLVSKHRTEERNILLDRILGV